MGSKKPDHPDQFAESKRCVDMETFLTPGVVEDLTPDEVKMVLSVNEHVMYAESGGNPDSAPETSHARGLFQLMPNEQKKYHITDTTECHQNSRAGVKILFGYAKELKHAGLKVTPGNIYLLHFGGDGAQGGMGVVRANTHNSSTPVESIMSAKAIDANDYWKDGKRVGVRYTRPNGPTVFLREMTVGDMSGWSDRKMAEPLPLHQKERSNFFDQILAEKTSGLETITHHPSENEPSGTKAPDARPHHRRGHHQSP